MASIARKDKRPTYKPQIVLSLPEKTFTQKTAVEQANELAEYFQKKDVAVEVIMRVMRDEIFEEYKDIDGDIFIGTEVEAEGDIANEWDERAKRKEAARDKYYAEYDKLRFYVDLDKKYNEMIIIGEDLMRGNRNE